MECIQQVVEESVREKQLSMPQSLGTLYFQPLEEHDVFPEEISKLEKEWGNEIPKDAQTFWLLGRGGHLWNDMLVVGDRHVQIQCIYPFREVRVCEYGLRVGYDACGNYFVLFDQGVGFHDHETNELSLLVASFDQFLEHLASPSLIMEECRKSMGWWADSAQDDIRKIEYLPLPPHVLPFCQRFPRMEQSLRDAMVQAVLSYGKVDGFRLLAQWCLVAASKGDTLGCFRRLQDPQKVYPIPIRALCIVMASMAMRQETPVARVRRSLGRQLVAQLVHNDPNIQVEHHHVSLTAACQAQWNEFL